MLTAPTQQTAAVVSAPHGVQVDAAHGRNAWLFEKRDACKVCTAVTPRKSVPQIHTLGHSKEGRHEAVEQRGAQQKDISEPWQCSRPWAAMRRLRLEKMMYVHGRCCLSVLSICSGKFLLIERRVFFSSGGHFFSVSLSEDCKERLCTQVTLDS